MESIMKQKSMINPKEQRPEPPSEDDFARAKLGSRGMLGEKEPLPGDPDKLQIPRHPDPGHTA
jgi:hypothetical protein